MAFDWRVALSAASSLLGQQNQMRASRKAQEDLLAGRRATVAEQEQADSRLNEELNRMRTSGPEDIQERSMADYATALRSSRATGGASLPSNIGSERFERGVTEADAGNVAYGNRVADLVSRIDAPATQRLYEGQGLARAGNDISRIGERAGTWDYLAQLRARRRLPNPWIDLLSKTGQAIAMNYQTKAERAPLVLPTYGPSDPLRPDADPAERYWE